MRLWSHNDFVEFLATGGIALAGAYIWLCIDLLKSCHRLAGNDRQTRAARSFGRVAGSATGAFVLFSLFNGVIFSASMIPFAVMIGLARAMYRTPGRTFVD